MSYRFNRTAFAGVALAALLAPAIADAQSNPPSNPAQQAPVGSQDPTKGAGAGAPGTPSSDMRGGATATAGPQNFTFRAEQQIGEWRGSKMVGLDVLGTDGKKIGDVRDVLVTAGGQITTVVLGVGGVLGMGEKLVGVPFESFEIAARTQASTTNPQSNSETARTGADPATTAAIKGSTHDAFVTRGGEPDHLVLRVDTQTLNAAPRFQYAGRGSAFGPEPASPAGASGMKDPPPAHPPQATPAPRAP